MKLLETFILVVFSSGVANGCSTQEKATGWNIFLFQKLRTDRLNDESNFVL